VFSVTPFRAFLIHMYFPALYVLSDILCSFCKWELKKFDGKLCKIWGSVSVWSLILGLEVLLWSSLSDVHKLLNFTQHVSVVLSVEHHEKLCFIVPSFEAGTILLSKMCCHFIQWNIWDGFCVTGCGIYVQFRKF